MHIEDKAVHIAKSSLRDKLPLLKKRLRNEMRLLDKRALEKSVSIKSIEKDAFVGRRER